MRYSFSSLPLISLSLVLSSCGGGSMPDVASAPEPIPSPSPSPTPTPTAYGGVLPPPSIGLQNEGDTFVSYGVAEQDTLKGERSGDFVWKDLGSTIAVTPGSQDQKVDFKYDKKSGEYAITLPDGTSGKLVLSALNGSVGAVASSTLSQVVASDGPTGAIVTMPTPQGDTSPYSYSHFGYWQQAKASGENTIQTYGVFAYGVPAGSVPVTGTGTYQGKILATSSVNYLPVDGSASIAFDFGKGVLTGWIHPQISTSGFYPELAYDFGRFDFAETIYATGSSKYSGAFSRDGQLVGGSFFEGSLTGPHAEETVGRFVLPVDYNLESGTLTGIWVGKK